jgi:hypothetical protein
LTFESALLSLSLSLLDNDIAIPQKWIDQLPQTQNTSREQRHSSVSPRVRNTVRTAGIQGADRRPSWSLRGGVAIPARRVASVARLLLTEAALLRVLAHTNGVWCHLDELTRDNVLDGVLKRELHRGGGGRLLVRA